MFAWLAVQLLIVLLIIYYRVVMQQKIFYVQPASGDTGLPLGLALYGADSISDNWKKIIGSKETVEKLQTPYSNDKNPLGDQVDKLINNILEKHKIPTKKIL